MYVAASRDLCHHSPRHLLPPQDITIIAHNASRNLNKQAQHDLVTYSSLGVFPNLPTLFAGSVNTPATLSHLFGAFPHREQDLPRNPDLFKYRVSADRTQASDSLASAGLTGDETDETTETTGTNGTDATDGTARAESMMSLCEQASRAGSEPAESMRNLMLQTTWASGQQIGPYNFFLPRYR